MTIASLRPYDFIVTGASGNVGRHLVPLLARGGRTVLAVGRDLDTLRKLFTDQPHVEVASYDALAGLTLSLIHI